MSGYFMNDGKPVYAVDGTMIGVIRHSRYTDRLNFSGRSLLWGWYCYARSEDYLCNKVLQEYESRKQAKQGGTR